MLLNDSKKIYLIAILPALIFLLIFIAASINLSGNEKSNILEPNLMNLPKFSLQTLYDEKQSLDTDEDFSDKYSIINIFASWCLSCLKEHKILMNLKKDNSLNIYGINWHDKKENAKKWLAQHGNPYNKIGYDYEGVAIIALGATAAPETYLVNPDKQIVFHHRGILTQNIVDNNIMNIMNKNQ